MVVFSLFAYGVFSKKNPNYFVLLFFIELLNREDALLIAVWGVVKKKSFEMIKVALLFIVMLTSILVFGLVNETRVYFILIPFILFFWLKISDQICLKR